MSKSFEPDPPVRKEGDFPPTNTIPSGWVMDELTAAYNPDKPSAREKPANPPAADGGSKANVPSGTGPVNDDDSFARRLDPFPFPGEQHSAWL